MPAGFLRALLSHIARAITCRHDGQGLPATPKAATFWLLLAMAVAAVAIKTITKGGSSYDAIAACLVFCVSVMGLSLFMGVALFAAVPLYFCVSLGLDMIESVTVLCGLGLPTPIPNIWELLCLLSAIAKVSRRVEAEKN